MALPHNALVLVADGRKVLFFRNNGDENQIDLRTEAHDSRRDRKDREIKTDAPGTQSPRVGIGRDTMEETDFHQQEEDNWIKDAADELKKRVLRKQLHKEVERRIVLTINKEMTDRPIPDIEELLVGEGAPPA